MFGIHNVYNIVAVISVCNFIGLSVDDICGGLAGFVNVSGRNEIILNGYTIINDAYNSNPSSAKSALKSLSTAFCGKRKIAVLSDMLELGEHAVSMHYEVGCFVSECNIDLLFVVGDLSAQYAKGAIDSGMNSDNVFVFGSIVELVAKLKSFLSVNDVVLIKGSRSMGMDEVVGAIKNP
jgi:UDP-N-acetylmuramyl pentapeptide synthase